MIVEAAQAESRTMTPLIALISTDFDGTLFAEFENPPVPVELQQLIGDLQARGARWVINTGRDTSSLLECVARAHLSIRPDFLVVVEREIYRSEGARYLPVEPWNTACARDHAVLFAEIQPDLPRLFAWINGRFKASVYSDPYSPFCLIAENNQDADTIEAFLQDYCCTVPDLAIMRNDVYARFCHVAYSKGTALAELARRLQIPRERVLAAGDHLNDLPMLSRAVANWLVAPANAIEPVKTAVRNQGGFVSSLRHGLGVAEGIRFCLQWPPQ
jgi:hydroxymethylpyrimidine pyrophosphatase-like HAD family hydrolase